MNTRTSHIFRTIYRELGCDLPLDNLGRIIGENTHPNPSQFRDSKSFAKAYQIYNLRRKVELSSATAAQQKAALCKWSSTEWRNRIVNLCGGWVHPIDRNERTLMKNLLRVARGEINRILVEAWPSLSLNPTNGATNITKRALSPGFSKLSGVPPVSYYPTNHKCVSRAKSYLSLILEEEPGLHNRLRGMNDEETPLCTASRLCENSPPAILDFVPKDEEEVRLIMLSGGITIMVQKTIGDAIRTALKVEGIDLNCQQVNQEWAEIGSHTGLVATVDESSASDSITLWLAETLLPERWFSYIMNTRDTHVSARNGGYVHKLEMVAGMGNGFIFELQSLIFYALSQAVVKRLGLNRNHVSVYGDDLIVPSDAVDLLSRLLLYCGVYVNENKTWTTGPFRESCGKHYFNGSDVTPIYSKCESIANTGDINHLYNGLLEWSTRTGNHLSKSLSVILRHLKQDERVWIPSTYGMRTGLYHTHDGSALTMPKIRRKRNHLEYQVVQRLFVVKQENHRERWSDSFALINWFLKAETRESILPKGWSPIWKAIDSQILVGGKEDWVVQRVEIPCSDAEGYERSRSSGKTRRRGA